MESRRDCPITPCFVNISSTNLRLAMIKGGTVNSLCNCAFITTGIRSSTAICSKAQMVFAGTGFCDASETKRFSVALVTTEHEVHRFAKKIVLFQLHDSASCRWAEEYAFNHYFDISLQLDKKNLLKTSFICNRRLGIKPVIFCIYVCYKKLLRLNSAMVLFNNYITSSFSCSSLKLCDSSSFIISFSACSLAQCEPVLLGMSIRTMF